MRHIDQTDTESHLRAPEKSVVSKWTVSNAARQSGQTASAKSPYFHYSAYGLNLCSTLKLPELPQTQETKACVHIRLGSLSNSPLEIDSTQHCFQLTPEGMYIFWQGVGTFLIQDGKEIIIDPVPDTDEDRLRLFILGAAIGVILHQRGFFVLHASAVDLNGYAAVFIGDKGAGKSTIAATLQRRGRALIADDVVALDLRHPGRPLVLPAFPQLKLWPDAVAALGANPEDLPQLISHLEKRNHRLTQGFVAGPLPLKHIYVLGRGSAVEIAPLQPQDLLTYLVRHSYVTRFGAALLQADRASHFLQLTQLARQVSVQYLLRPADLELLPLAAQRVEEQGCEDE